MPNNEEFLRAIFGEDLPFVHVTDFAYDPSNIPNDKHLVAWKGDWYSRYRMSSMTNQYFTISIFNPDDQGVARRRKALYIRTRCLVLDDVKEKLCKAEADKLPSPSWIMETSPGSEQWGYILTEPCYDMSRIDNLNDGLIASNLAPAGKDPGQKGVTRYVRLPDGINNKSNKLVGGLPFKCRITLWQPFNTVSLEELAAPFAVNLDAVRRESRTDGAAAVPDHPLLQITDLIHVHDVRSDGRFDIRCPWVSEHTGGVDNGAAVFTNEDGSIGFKCHHGACETRTAKDLLNLIEQHKPGFRQQFASWQGIRAFKDVANVSFMDPAPAPAAAPWEEPASPLEGVLETKEEITSLDDLLGELNRERPGTARSTDLAKVILKSADQLGAIDKKNWHDRVCDAMMWSKGDFKMIIKDLQREWYGEKSKATGLFENLVFVKELNKFYDFVSRIVYTPEAFHNSFAHDDDEARKSALVDGMVTKVERLNYAPRRPRIYVDEFGMKFGNTWCEISLRGGVSGDASRWLDHFSALGWGKERDHVLKWMAFTLRYPETKINHALLLGSGEGCGKDFLLYPLIKALGNNSTTIQGDELLSDFTDYLFSTKFLHVNETELGSHADATRISNKLKPLAAGPPDQLRVNPKNLGAFKIDNIVNTAMTTNSTMPLKLPGVSRRYFALWSDMITRDDDDTMLPEWQSYWDDRWTWMKGGGYDACIHYLHNCVDLSDFDAGAAPPMTDFLREIREASKTPLQQTLEALIANRIGSLAADLITTQDLIDMCKGADLIAPTLVCCDLKSVSTNRATGVLAAAPGVHKLCTHEFTGSQLWALRNRGKYMRMSTKELMKEYQDQANLVRKSLMEGRELRAVK